MIDDFNGYLLPPTMKPPISVLQPLEWPRFEPRTSGFKTDLLPLSHLTKPVLFFLDSILFSFFCFYMLSFLFCVCLICNDLEIIFPFSEWIFFSIFLAHNKQLKSQCSIEFRSFSPQIFCAGLRAGLFSSRLRLILNF